MDAFTSWQRGEMEAADALRRTHAELEAERKLTKVLGESQKEAFAKVEALLSENFALKEFLVPGANVNGTVVPYSPEAQARIRKGLVEVGEELRQTRGVVAVLEKILPLFEAETEALAKAHTHPSTGEIEDVAQEVADRHELIRRAKRAVSASDHHLPPDEDRGEGERAQ